MTLKIHKNLAPVRAGVNCFGTGNPKKYVTVHQTGNTTRGANAKMHAMLQQRGFSASWHWQVDDKEAIQSFSHDYRIYCQGDGYNGIGNNQAISVEICVNSDGNYKQAVTNGAELVAKIMKEEGIGIDDVHQHNFFNGKNCPAQICYNPLSYHRRCHHHYGQNWRRPV